jgi:holin-like protein
MKFLNQLSIIFILWAIGEYVSSLISGIILIPGSIIAMVLLFLMLKLKIIKLESIEEISTFFLDNMIIFFIPTGVSLINSLDLIRENIFVLIVSVFISTISVMYITGKSVQFMINKNKERENV